MISTKSESSDSLQISREAFASYEKEIALLRESMHRANTIIELYSKHMSIGKLRHIREEINQEREGSSERALGLGFLDDLSMKLKLHSKYHNKGIEQIEEIEKERKEIFNEFLKIHGK